MMQSVTFHFYEIRLDIDEGLFDTGEDQIQRLKAALKSTTKPDHVYLVNNYMAFVKHIDGDIFCFEKHRRTELPTIGKVTEDTERQIRLAKDETLIEKNFFILSDNGFIIYHEKKEGYRAQSLAAYIKQLFSVDNGVSVLQILRRDSYQRLTRFGYIKAIDVEFASPSDALLREWGVSLDNRILYRSRPGIKVGVQVKLNQKQPITRDFVDGIINRLRRSDGAVNRLTVKGSEDAESNIDEVNFANDALEERVNVRGYPAKKFERDIIDVLTQMMERYEEEVNDLLGNDNEDD